MCRKLSLIHIFRTTVRVLPGKLTRCTTSLTDKATTSKAVSYTHLAVSYDDKHFAAPTLENAINKTYPIVRPLYYYYNKMCIRDSTGRVLQECKPSAAERPVTVALIMVV